MRTVKQSIRRQLIRSSMKKGYRLHSILHIVRIIESFIDNVLGE
jgi:hypothetical protein